MDSCVVIGVVGRFGVYVPGLDRIDTAPTTSTSTSGTIFSSEVTTCTRPPVLTPNRLTPTNIHMNETASMAGGIFAAAGKTVLK